MSAAWPRALRGFAAKACGRFASPDHGEETLELRTVSAARKSHPQKVGQALPLTPLVCLTASVYSPHVAAVQSLSGGSSRGAVRPSSASILGVIRPFTIQLLQQSRVERFQLIDVNTGRCTQ